MIHWNSLYILRYIVAFLFFYFSLTTAAADFALDCDKYPFEQDAQTIIKTIKEGNEEGVYCLLRNGADKDGVDQYGNTPVMAAAVRGETRIVQALMNQGAKLDTQDRHGYTALMKATSKDYHDITVMLIESGEAGIDLQSGDDGYTAMMIAAINNNLNGPIRCPATVSALLKAGTDLSLKSKGDIDGGKTVLHWAAMKGRDSIVRALLKKMSMGLIDTQDNQGRTAIMCAVDKNAQNAVIQLLEKGADLSTLAANGDSALSIAVAYANCELITIILEASLKRGDSINLLMNVGWNGAIRAIYYYVAKKLEPTIGSVMEILESMGIKLSSSNETTSSAGTGTGTSGDL